MSLQDWLVRESLRRRITVLGISLDELKSRFEGEKSRSSKTVERRLENSEADYWRAIEAFRTEHFSEAKQAASAASLEVEFVRKLMESETVERELGEGKLFELSDSLDEKEATQRIGYALKQITLELSDMLATLRAASN